jgi:hypothetical protein
MGFYITGSSFQTRPTLSPHPHCLPRHFGLAPAPSSHGYDPYTKIWDPRRLPTTRLSAYPHPAAERQPPYHANRVRHYSDRIQPVPRAWTTSPPFRSWTTPSPGQTHCVPDATYQMRQRISRHSPSPTSHNALTSRGETIRLSPFLSTQGSTDATTRPCLEL